MRDPECTAFLQWALPHLRLRWKGFRRVRRQVCKRIARRLDALELADLDAYRLFLESDEAEWRTLDELCRVTISRFYRDRSVFDYLGRVLLPEIALAARRRGEVRVWCAGCASGEEPYTLKILWHMCVAERQPGVALRIVATDIDRECLDRARAGRYPASTLKDLPAGWRATAFTLDDGRFRIKPGFRRDVEFRHEDIRSTRPAGFFDLVLCRNLIFTYFCERLQRPILEDIVACLRPGGGLVIGSTEALPGDSVGLVACPGARGVFRKL